jgi:DNA-directed RNA polymerase specialized sigma24 family protein
MPTAPMTHRSATAEVLSDPAFRRDLAAAVRGRVPSQEVEEIVQQTLADALIGRAPESREELRRWIFGIARHKVIDFHRRRSRETPTAETAEIEAPAAIAAPHDALDLLRWAEREAPEASHTGRTLDWLLREGDGEKLEDIARAEALPAPQVRQRVARLRRHYRARWALIAAALAGAIAIAIVVRRSKPRTTPAPNESPSVLPAIDLEPVLEARRLRERALLDCAEERWIPCLDGLDQAAALDPAGEDAPSVRDARAGAAAALAPAPPETAPSEIVVPPTKTPERSSTGTGASKPSWGKPRSGGKGKGGKASSEFEFQAPVEPLGEPLGRDSLPP